MKDQDLRPFLGLQRNVYLKMVRKKNRREKLHKNYILQKGILMDDHYKFVRFDEYCQKCKWYRRDEHLDPCNECLDYGAREGTEIPMKFEEVNIK